MKQPREMHFVGRLVSKSEKARATLLWGRLQGTVSKREKAGAADEPGVAVFHTSRVSLCGLACAEGIMPRTEHPVLSADSQTYGG